MGVELYRNLLRRIYTSSSKTFLIRAGGGGLLFVLHIILGQNLGPEQYGLYSFALAVTTLLAAFASLGLPTALLRYAAQYQEQDRRDKLKGTVYLMPVYALLSSILVAALISLLLFIPFADQDYLKGMWLTVFLLPVFVLGTIRHNLYKAFRRPLASLIPDEIIRPILLGTAVMILGLNNAQDVVFLYVAISLVLALAFLFWLYHNLSPTLAGIKPTYMPRKWIITALPMVVGSIGYIIMNRTDVIMLGVMDDMEVVGVYSAANRIAMLNQFILGAAAVVVTPLLTSAYHGNRLGEFKAIMNHTRIWVLVRTVPFVALMILVPGKLLMLFGAEYVEGEWLLRILAFGQLVHAVAGPVGSALLMTGKQNMMAVTMILVAGLNILLNFAVIPIYGALGAACVTAFCLIVANAVLVVAVHKLA